MEYGQTQTPRTSTNRAGAEKAAPIGRTQTDPRSMRHLFLAPHLDDAVLSCGGQIALLTAQGVPVHVLTVFAGDAPTEELSDLARSLHQAWGGSGDPFALRRREDERALRQLGATHTHLPYGDAIYRRARSGGPLLYPDREAIFGPVAREEATAFPQALAREIAPFCEPPSQVVLHVPLAVGHHVDHQILRAAALELAQAGHTLHFYEDYPYNEDSGELDQALQTLPPLQALVIPCDEPALQARLRAIACYASQIGILFGGVEQMQEATHAHAARLAREAGTAHPYAEREWVLA